MFHIAVSWVTIAGGLWLANKLLDGMRIRGDLGSFLVVAAVFGTLNWALGKLVFVLLGVATLGLGFLLAFATRLVVTALMLSLADKLSDRLRLDSFKVALLAALILTLVGAAVDALLR